MTGGHSSANLIIADSSKARLSRSLHRGWGWCHWCGFPWAVREGHSTTYERTEGSSWAMFPLCTRCWELLDAEDKLFSYRVYLMDIEDMASWPQIKAVLLDELAGVKI